MARSSTSLLLLMLSAAVTLAGCTGGGDGGDDLAAAAQDLDLAATATTGVIRGIVVDDALRPLSSANVTLTSGQQTSTNEEGAFGFDALEPGTYFFSVTLVGYSTVQQSVDVVAGVSDPSPVRVLLAALPTQDPFIEQLTVRMFVSGSGWVDGVGGITAGGLGVLEGNFAFTQEFTPNATVVQTEFVWQPTTDLGATAMASGGTYNEDGGVDTDDWNGPSPLVTMVNGTDDGDVADRLSFTFWAWPGTVPAGVHLNQNVDVFITVFHNFRPADGWSFARDGPHPVPE